MNKESMQAVINGNRAVLNRTRLALEKVTLDRDRLKRANDLNCEQLDIKIAELARLQAIVDKLPKTADGVLVSSTMEVWLPGERGNGEIDYIGAGDVVLVNDSIFWPPPRNGYICDESDEYQPSIRTSSTLYSTREAAEAAKHG